MHFVIHVPHLGYERLFQYLILFVLIHYRGYRFHYRFAPIRKVCLHIPFFSVVFQVELIAINHQPDVAYVQFVLAFGQMSWLVKGSVDRPYPVKFPDNLLTQLRAFLVHGKHLQQNLCAYAPFSLPEKYLEPGVIAVQHHKV